MRNMGLYSAIGQMEKQNNNIKKLVDLIEKKDNEINKLNEKINKAIIFVETQHNTYQSAEEWRKALLDILK